MERPISQTRKLYYRCSLGWQKHIPATGTAMKSIRQVLTCCCPLLVLCSASLLSGREWHRNDGTFIAAGKLLSVKKGQLTILTEDGKKLPVAFDELSLEDAAFVQEAVHGQQSLLG